MPHLLAALLTPTRTPHARLLKHWVGRIVSLALVRHSLLARFSRPLLFPLTLFSSRFSLLTLFSSDFSILTLFSSHFSLLTLFSSHFFSSECTSRSFLYLRAVSVGCRPPQAHPAPLARGYHNDPCAPKKGRRRSSRKIAAEEEWGRASELVKEMCVNVSVVKKKASHKRGDLSFTLLNTSHLRSH